jgi:hypothetical protein
VTPDAQSARCPHCGSPPGSECVTTSGRDARKPHARRVRLALAVAAHADPALDAYFPRAGFCGICGVPGLWSRHRVVDSIAGHLAAGECEGDVAEEMGVSLDAVMAVEAWARKWPGAWR